MKEMFDPEFYRKLPLLLDMTLLECKNYILTTDEIKDLLQAVVNEKGWKEAVARIHFHGSDKRTDCPDEMTHGEWLKLNGSISIDIGDGGSKVKEREPEFT